MFCGRLPPAQQQFCSIAILAGGASPALAGSTGGVSAEAPAPAAVKHAKAKKKAATSLVPPNAAPVTQKSQSVAYSGPVYVKNAAGEVVPYVAPTTATAAAAEGSVTGGAAASPTEEATPATPELLVPGTRARYVNGLAAAPMSAPAQVQEIVWTANEIIGLPYIYGGGHASFVSPGYDCSGTVSFALHGASLLQHARGLLRIRKVRLARDRALGDGLLQPRPRLHGRRGAAARHERRRRPLQPAGAALAPAAPGQRRLRRAAPARALDAASATLEVAGRIGPAAPRNRIGGSDGRPRPGACQPS